MSTLTKEEAMKLMETINLSNIYKQHYVRVAERETILWDVEGGYKLRSYVNVYSKTWSRRVAKLVVDDEELTTKQARKYLSN